MTKLKQNLGWVAAACASFAFGQAPTSAPDQKAAESATVARVTLKSCKPIRISGALGLILTMNGSTNVELNRKGVLREGDRDISIFLPDEPYSIKNTAESDQVSQNTASLVAVDADGDGNIGEGESWFVNLPVRIADKMYDIVGIDEKGKWIELALSAKPMSGAVVGSTLPDFSYKTSDGKAVTNADFRGKSYLIDIWSVT